MALRLTHAAAHGCDIFLKLRKQALRCCVGARTMNRLDEGSAMGRAAGIAHVFALGWALVFLPAAPAQSQQAQQAQQTFDTSAANLLVVLRESHGQNKPDEALRPFGKVRGVLADGREVDVDISWYKYLGDMHLRLVFDGGQSMQSASSEDLARLHLTPDEALKLAVANLKRLYGAPAAQPWTGGLMQVQGRDPDFNSSYFLDRDFWRTLQAQHPEGLVVAVPRRGGLVYAPAADEAAVESLRFSVAALYAGGPGARLSSALYLFKDGHWSVFQPPQEED
jgi:hypothetical protein